jgi:hypothetical protein
MSSWPRFLGPGDRMGTFSVDADVTAGDVRAVHRLGACTFGRNSALPRSRLPGIDALGDPAPHSCQPALGSSSLTEPLSSWAAGVKWAGQWL